MPDTSRLHILLARAHRRLRKVRDDAAADCIEEILGCLAEVARILAALPAPEPRSEPTPEAEPPPETEPTPDGG